MSAVIEIVALQPSGVPENKQVDPCDLRISCCFEELVDFRSDACSSREYQPENDIPEHVKNMLRAWDQAHLHVSSMHGSQNRFSMKQASPIEARTDRLLPPQRFIKSSKRAHVG